MKKYKFQRYHNFIERKKNIFKIKYANSVSREICIFFSEKICVILRFFFFL